MSENKQTEKDRKANELDIGLVKVIAEAIKAFMDDVQRMRPGVLGKIFMTLGDRATEALKEKDDATFVANMSAMLGLMVVKQAVAGEFDIHLVTRQQHMEAARAGEDRN